jgi:melibiose permease/lactose/raffinose/galactose permease
MLKILLSNKQLMVMAVVVLLYSLGSAILNAFGQNFFYFKFGYLGDGSSLSGGTMMTIFTVIYALGTIISQAVYPTLANKFKRSQLINYSIVLLAVGYTMFFLLANILSGMACFILLCVLGIFIFAGQGVFYLTMLVMLTNTIEYGEWQTGKNNAPIIFTIRPFMVKLSGAVQYGVVALTLIICGLYTITNQVGDVEVAIGMFNEGETMVNCLAYLQELGHDMTKIAGYMLNAGSEVAGLKEYASSLFVTSSGAIWGLTAIMCVLPIIMFVVAWYVIKKKYIIDEEMYEKILLEIKERKEG